jgi:hypothetical protein
VEELAEIAALRLRHELPEAVPTERLVEETGSKARAHAVEQTLLQSSSNGTFSTRLLAARCPKPA